MVMRANQIVKNLALLIDEYIFGHTLYIHIHSTQCIKPTKLQSQPTLYWLLMKKSYTHIFYKHWIVIYISPKI